LGRSAINWAGHQVAGTGAARSPRTRTGRSLSATMDTDMRNLRNLLFSRKVLAVASLLVVIAIALWLPRPSGPAFKMIQFGMPAWKVYVILGLPDQRRFALAELFTPPRMVCSEVFHPVDLVSCKIEFWSAGNGHDRIMIFFDHEDRVVGKQLDGYGVNRLSYKAGDGTMHENSIRDYATWTKGPG
jgi:hypothetical protein